MRAFEIDLEPSSVTHSALPSHCYAGYLRHHHHRRRHFPARHNHHHHNHHRHQKQIFTSNFDTYQICRAFVFADPDI